MRKRMGLLAFLLMVVVVLSLAAVTPVHRANADDDEEESPFAEAHLFFELNDTDGDLGIHALIDGDAWKKLEIEDPKERQILLIWVMGRLRRQGLTEIFFESAEPSFDDLAPANFFKRFPEGTYEIGGTTLDGKELESKVELSHKMPAPPGGISLSGTPVNLENVDCDKEDTIPKVGGSQPVVISWAAVTTSHPEIGTPNNAPVMIHNYEVVVEVEIGEFTSVFSVTLPPDVTEMTIPPQVLALGEEFKYEILVREENFNQTAIESCFKKE
jgi:hypothetical protein